jgi:RNA polymerase subunit RPABC4/transcription elongation factor Spt4
MLVGCSTAASLFPFVGTIVYMILRPPEYLEDVRERELEMHAAEARLHELDHALCPHCDYRVERDFVRCPSCLRKLKERCVRCSRPLDQAWTICPYCETEVAAAPASRRTRRRRPTPPLESDRSSAASSETLVAGAASDRDDLLVETDLEEIAGARAKVPGPATAAGEEEEEARAPFAASKPATRPGGGRASRPGGRARPTS